MQTLDAKLTSFLSLSTEDHEAVYAFGYHLYENGLYKKAIHFFRTLTLMNPKNAKYWKGLGATYQMLREFDRALESYGVAALLNENDPLVHWHASECFLMLKKPEEAREATHSAALAAKREPKKYQFLIDKIALIEKAQKRGAKRK